MVSFTLHFQLHPIKPLVLCYIVSFYKLLHRYFRLKYHVPKRQLTDHFKTANSLLLSQKLSYKLLNMSTPNKTLCTVRTFSFKNNACYPICKLLNTIYEHDIDKQGWKGVFNIVSGVKW